jgi:hypothetical protein
MANNNGGERGQEDPFLSIVEDKPETSPGWAQYKPIHQQVMKFLCEHKSK